MAKTNVKVPTITETRKILNKKGVGGIDDWQLKILKTRGCKIRPNSAHSGVCMAEYEGKLWSGSFAFYYGHSTKPDFQVLS